MLKSQMIRARRPGSDRVLVVLHGLGDTYRGYAWLPDALDLPDLNYVLVNAPDPYYQGYAWYDLFGDSGTGIRRSRAALDELLAGLWASGFEPENTALMGFSQGCVMTLEVGLRAQRRMACLVGISGYVFEGEKLAAELTAAGREAPVLVTHGDRDPLLPLDEVREQMARLKKAGAPLEWREYAKAHEIDGDQEMPDIRAFLVRNLRLASM